MIKRGEEARTRQTCWCLSGSQSPKQTSSCQQLFLSPAVHNNHINQVCSLLFIQESPSRCFASSASTAGLVLAGQISPESPIVSRRWEGVFIHRLSLIQLSSSYLSEALRILSPLDWQMQQKAAECGPSQPSQVVSTHWLLCRAHHLALTHPPTLIREQMIFSHEPYDPLRRGTFSTRLLYLLGCVCSLMQLIWVHLSPVLFCLNVTALTSRLVKHFLFYFER